MPYLRGQQKLKNLLYHYGAKLKFTKDYVNTKLIGHRYQLTGQIHIVDSDDRFVLLDFEGFYLEFSLGIIQDSLQRFLHNYAAKHLRKHFKHTQQIIHAIAVASRLIGYQHYLVDERYYSNEINPLLEQEPLVIPVTYQGHAITFIKFGSFLAKCDRGENSKFEGPVVIYQMEKPEACNKDLIKQLIYKKNSDQVIHSGVNQHLGLKPIMILPLSPQESGNCSWANVEAAIPTLLFLLMLHENPKASELEHYRQEALDFFEQWREWDKDRALDECIHSFESANRYRKASKAAILISVMFQYLNYLNDQDLARASRINKIIQEPEYQCLLQAHIDTYYTKEETEEGRRLMHLLDLAKF